ncbi:class I adenylate-forming enzyme family protein [Natrialbaceae archaeon A-gly3]
MTLSIHARADHYGTRTAVIDRDTGESYSYDDLASMAERYARGLAERGVGEGDAICVLSRNRPELLGLFYAAVDLGAILAPISHRLPEGDVATLRERIRPALVCCESRFEDLAGEDAVGIGELLEDGEAGVGEGSIERLPPDPERPLLYLHTGGTTGVPKVVVLPYRQVEYNCITEVAAWGLGKDDVSPVFLPLFHTGGWHLLTLPTLFVGGQVALHRDFDPESALETIEACGATHVFGVAAIFKAMAGAERFSETDFSSVDWFMSGGGPTPAAVIDAYRERGQRFTQGYGLTEGGPNNLYLDPDRGDVVEKVAESVGRPFPDCSARVVDEDGEPVETGEVGELELSGPVTAAGYLATEDGTFDGEWVSTGDLVRRDEDGDFYVVGRTDNRFVSGGENVSPERIEEVLESHPDVAAAGVVAVPHEKWGTVPKAVVVPDGDLEISDDLEAHCREHLADYEIPHAYETAAELPRSGPGKLDRSALEERHGSIADEDDGDARGDPA